jgi:iron complex outermembrane recepter protein
MKPLQKIILVLSLSLLCIGLNAQGVVKGIILESGTDNTYLIGATVVVEGTTTGTVTNIDGAFSLKLPKQKVTLVMSYMGYIEQTFEVDVPAGTEKDLGIIEMKPSTIGLDEVQVSASFVRDRRTPVSISTIDPITIETKLGTQEFPEILKTTPSVYATKSGGGFGDSRIVLRGFNSNNLGILINGIPINDMENGTVYWSNWTSLSDVTMSQQVQRGLGASKLGLSSVGGTINIITRSTDAEQGGNVYAGVGNDGYYKQSFLVSTGLNEKGWAVTFFGSHNKGDGFVKATNYEAWTYFFNISKIINDKHRLVFTGFGSPQWHNQRNNKHLIQEYRNHPDGIRWNSDYGYRNGKIYNTGYSYNFYHKPQFSLSHYWKIGEFSMLSTQAYASMAKGGGRRISGTNSNWLARNYPAGTPTDITKLTPEGYYDYDAVIAANKESIVSTCIISNAVNAHDWYGLLSNLTIERGEMTFTIGYDGRYYRGYHGTKIDDLLGGSYFKDATDKSRNANQMLKNGDFISSHYFSEVLWNGLFGQAEVVNERYSGFLSLAVAQKSYRRTDFFLPDSVNNRANWVSFLPWNIKGGFDYKFNENHHVYVNTGLVYNAPVFTNVFNYSNNANKKAKYEKIYTAEIGYGLSYSQIEVKLDGFFTKWEDRAFSKDFGNNVIGNITGVNALHKGIELESTYKPNNKLEIKGMLSVGDYRWINNVHFDAYDQNNEYQGSANLYIKNLHVANGAQLTVSLSCDYEVLPKLKVGAVLVYYGKNYSDYDVLTRTDSTTEVTVWQMPNVAIVDMNLNYRFKIGKLNATFYTNVTNLFNTEYITDATDGANHDQYTSFVWYGFGRTWSSGLRVKF